HVRLPIAAQNRAGLTDQAQGFFDHQRPRIVAGGDHHGRPRRGRVQPRLQVPPPGGRRAGGAEGPQGEAEVGLRGASRRGAHIAAPTSSGESASRRPPVWGGLVWTKLAIFWLPMITGVNGSIVMGARGSSWCP